MNIQGDAVVPEYPTNAPTAGWYPDPSDATQERWWGGVEWTHDVRPLAVSVPVPQPALANVPGGGINPFAAVDAQESSQSYGAFSDSFAPVASNFSSFGSFDTGTVTTAVAPDPFGGTAAQSPGVADSWYDASRRGAQRPEPTNGIATVGLVLSLVGLNVIGIIVSVLGLRKARGFEENGDLPVGRKRARWGLGLGIASFIISLALIAAWLFAFQYFYALYVEQFGSGVVQTETGDDAVSSDTPAAAVDDGSYVRADYENAIRDEYAQDGYAAPDTITCPDVGSTIDGVIVCEIVTGDLVETRTAEYYPDGGYAISTSSFSG